MLKKLTKDKQYSAVFGTLLYPDSWAAKKIAQKLSIPYFVKVHGSDVNRLDKGHILLAQSLDVVNKASKVFSVSEGLKHKLVTLGAPSNNVSVIRNGIDKKIFTPCSVSDARKKLSILDNSKIILFVGNLKREKGLGELLHAFKNVRNSLPGADVDLYLIGEGPFKAEIRQKAFDNGLIDFVHFLGKKLPSDIALWMNAANLLCLPSYSEGLPNVVLEALSCNTPVVATDIDGITELARQDARILTVPQKNIHLLAEAISTVLNLGEKTSGGLIVNSWAENAKLVSQIIGDCIHGINSRLES